MAAGQVADHPAGHLLRKDAESILIPGLRFLRLYAQRRIQQRPAQILQRLFVCLNPAKAGSLIGFLQILLGKQKLHAAFSDCRLVRRLLPCRYQRSQQVINDHSLICPAAHAVMAVIAVAEMVIEGVDLQPVDLGRLELVQRHGHQIGGSALLHQRKLRHLGCRGHPARREDRQHHFFQGSALAAASLTDQEQMRELDACHPEIGFQKAACGPRHNRDGFLRGVVVKEICAKVSQLLCAEGLRIEDSALDTDVLLKLHDIQDLRAARFDGADRGGIHRPASMLVNAERLDAGLPIPVEAGHMDFQELQVPVAAEVRQRDGALSQKVFEFLRIGEI